jgi:hypothetical protein
MHGNVGATARFLVAKFRDSNAVIFSLESVTKLFPQRYEPVQALNRVRVRSNCSGRFGRMLGLCRAAILCCVGKPIYEPQPFWSGLAGAAWGRRSITTCRSVSTLAWVRLFS